MHTHIDMLASNYMHLGAEEPKVSHLDHSTKSSTIWETKFCNDIYFYIQSTSWFILIKNSQ